MLRIPHVLPLALAGILPLASLALAAGTNDPSFNLVNRGSSPVHELYVTPSGDPNWGRNRLQGADVPPGGSFAVHRRPGSSCFLDIRVVFADRRSEERRKLNTCTLDAVAVGGPEQTLVKNESDDDPSFRLVNRGGVPLREFYVTPSGVPSWGHNRLSAEGLPADTATVVRMARTNQCYFDLRAVFADHRALEQRHIDLCRITDVPVP
jgi:hypothetical protein